MKKLVLLAFLSLIIGVFSLSIPDPANAQGFVYCYVSTLNACEPDYLPGDDINEFVECDPGFDPPSSCIGNPQTCCTSQPPTTCQNVSCVPSGPLPPQCPPGQTCTGVDPGLCASAGGSGRACSTPSGSTGSCCQPDAPTETCPGGYYCHHISGGGGAVPIYCRETLGGIWGNCLSPSEPDGDGNCCVPQPGSCTPNLTCQGPGGRFLCEWVFASTSCPIATQSCCLANISLSQCVNNYGHDDFVCLQFLNQSDCQGCGINLSCIEQNPTIGYYCAGATLGGCQPCFSWSADPNDPSYIPACNPPPFATIGECDPSGNGTCNIPIPPSTSNTALCRDGVSINTAIGCIPVSNTNAFISFLLRWGIGIAGGIAFLLILFAGFQIITSGGDPKKLQAGKELLTSAIAGLLLLIFSIFILRLVGVNILGLPQFG